MRSAPTPDEQVAGSIVSTEENGTTTAQFTDPGPLGIQFDWKKTVSAEVELTIDSLAIGFQAEKMGGLQPGMLVLSIDGIQIRGLPQTEVMSALKQRPVTIAFGRTAAADPSTLHAVDDQAAASNIPIHQANEFDAEIDVDEELQTRVSQRRRRKRRVVEIHQSPQGTPESSNVPDFPAKAMDPKLTALPEVNMQWCAPIVAGDAESNGDFSDEEWEARMLRAGITVDHTAQLLHSQRSLISDDLVRSSGVTLSVSANADSAIPAASASVAPRSAYDMLHVHSAADADQRSELAQATADAATSEILLPGNILLGERVSSNIPLADRTPILDPGNSTQFTRDDSIDGQPAGNARGPAAAEVASHPLPLPATAEPAAMAAQPDPRADDFAAEILGSATGGSDGDDDSDALAAFLADSPELGMTKRLDSWIEQSLGVLSGTRNGAAANPDVNAQVRGAQTTYFFVWRTEKP
jgi:hypothetical protein